MFVIKNVKSVIVPNTNGMKGLKASVAIGIVGGNAEKELEILARLYLNEKLEFEYKIDKLGNSLKTNYFENEKDLKFPIDSTSLCKYLYEDKFFDQNGEQKWK